MFVQILLPLRFILIKCLPIRQNNVEELYSLFKFLRLKPLSDWPTFKSQVAQPIKSGRVVRAMKRLQFVLSAVMLRRTKTTILNGKPLLDLPDRLVNNVFCEFDATEKAFYGSIQERIQESVRKLQEQSNVKNTYTSILVLLLRLRQGALASLDSHEPMCTKIIVPFSLQSSFSNL